MPGAPQYAIAALSYAAADGYGRCAALRRARGEVACLLPSAEAAAAHAVFLCRFAPVSQFIRQRRVVAFDTRYAYRHADAFCCHAYAAMILMRRKGDACAAEGYFSFSRRRRRLFYASAFACRRSYARLLLLRMSSRLQIVPAASAWRRACAATMFADATTYVTYAAVCAL